MVVCSATTDKCSAYLLEISLVCRLSSYVGVPSSSHPYRAPPSPMHRYRRGLLGPKPRADITGASCEPETQMFNDCPDASETQKSCIKPGWKAHLPKEQLANLSHRLRFIFSVWHTTSPFIWRNTIDQRIFNSPDLPWAVGVLNHTL